jgi:hypothetical protein
MGSIGVICVIISITWVSVVKWQPTGMKWQCVWYLWEHYHNFTLCADLTYSVTTQMNARTFDTWTLKRWKLNEGLELTKSGNCNSSYCIKKNMLPCYIWADGLYQNENQSVWAHNRTSFISFIYLYTNTLHKATTMSTHFWTSAHKQASWWKLAVS